MTIDQPQATLARIQTDIQVQEIWITVMESCYWIKSYISNTLLKRRCLFPHVVRIVGGTSLPQHRGNPVGSYLANF